VVVNKRSFVAALLLAAAAVLGAADPQLLLPQGVKADWAWGPGPALAASTRFTAGKKQLWLLPRPQFLTNNKGQSLLLLFEAQDMAQDRQGVLWFCDGKSAGTLDLAPDLHSAALKSRLLLPSAAWRLADGGEQGMLAWGSDPDDGQAALIRLRDRHVLLRWPRRLSAVADTPKGLVLATPAGLLRVADDGKARALPFLKAARSLAWVEGAGLAVADGEGVWLLPEGKAPIPFLSAAGVRLQSAGDSLYVLLPAQGAVLRLRGLDHLK
jgi:hypothetical protein